ncbi:MAG TPA: ABC transporter ATP-binding protein [Myxococcota bacterium]|nr:ABC transporter ATP-binding protein [Myxococcota bacterium]
MDQAIVVEHLTKKFGTYFAVQDISFTLKRGQTMGLIGGNGAGKTTTLAMIMGLTIPTAGHARVLGYDMTKHRHQVLSRMNFQSPYVAMPGRLTVRENLNVFGRLYNVKNLQDRIAMVVYDLGLGELFNCETGALSAGQKARVSLAKALLNSPEILVLDEPTASLDPTRSLWVRELLKNYQREREATVLMTSHNMLEVEQMCDSVAIMHNGKILAIVATATLRAQYQGMELEKIIELFAGRQTATVK